jgi:hypothetical protein
MLSHLQRSAMITLDGIEANHVAEDDEAKAKALAEAHIKQRKLCEEIEARISAK